MVQFPQSTDNVVWARDAEDILRSSPNAIELFGSRVAPATQLLEVHFESELVEQIRHFVPAESNWGDDQLKQLVGHYEGVATENIILTSGATQGFDLVCRAVLRHGDEVIVERPGYQVLPRIVEDYGAVAKRVRRGSGTDMLDLEEVRAACTKRTRLIAVTNLHNPTGSELKDDFLGELAKVANSVGAILLIDEVYRDFLPDSERLRSSHEPQHGVVRINSLAKTFGVDMLACGWLIAPAQIRSRLHEHYARSLISVSKLALRAAVVVFEHLPDYLAHQQTVMARNTPVFDSFIADARAMDLIRGVRPNWGPIAFIQATGVNDDRIWPWLAATRDLLLIPGDIYGVPGCTRIGFGGNTQKLTEGLDRLLDGLREWRRREEAGT
jgi:aspartate/methionine/tyrosine aminotransferase